MQHVKAPHPSYTEPSGPVSGAEETEALVVLEWAVPTAAKVPALRKLDFVAIITVRPASITSTVSAKVITELRANNTALNSAWCITATLATGSRARL